MCHTSGEILRLGYRRESRPPDPPRRERIRISEGPSGDAAVYRFRAEGRSESSTDCLPGRNETNGSCVLLPTSLFARFKSRRKVLGASQTEPALSQSPFVVILEKALPEALSTLSSQNAVNCFRHSTLYDYYENTLIRLFGPRLPPGGLSFFPVRLFTTSVCSA